jgi:hypothetical protein
MGRGGKSQISNPFRAKFQHLSWRIGDEVGAHAPATDALTHIDEHRFVHEQVKLRIVSKLCKVRPNAAEQHRRLRCHIEKHSVAGTR